MLNNQFILKGILRKEKEDEDFFLKRADLYLSLEEMPFSLEKQKKEDNEIKEGLQLVFSLFKVYPSWIPLFYREKKSLFFGGFFILDEENFPPLYLELNPRFKEKTSFLGYKKREIIAHECVHAIRAHMEEPSFEEILAYQTSTSPFTKFFGPLFQDPKEVLLILSFLLASVFFSFLSFFYEELFFLTPLFLSLSLSFCFVSLCRLIYLQSLFKKACKALIKQGKDPLPLLLLATDKQIKNYSRL